MQANQNQIYQHCGDHSLEDADGDGSFAHGLQLIQAEFIADGEGDEAKGGLGDDGQVFHLFQGVEAETGELQGAQAKGSQQ